MKIEDVEIPYPYAGRQVNDARRWNMDGRDENPHLNLLARELDEAYEISTARKKKVRLVLWSCLGIAALALVVLRAVWRGQPSHQPDATFARVH